MGKEKNRKYKIKCQTTIFKASQNTIGQPTIKSLWVIQCHLRKKKKQGERNSNERRKPNVPSSGFKPFQDGIPGIVLTFQSRRQSLGTSKWARPNLVMDSHFYLSPGWGNRFPINHPRRGCRNVPTGSDPLRSFLNLRKTWAAQALGFT